jgi:dTDP-6-deoxy-L-talose 4-dehydrogenase (NAD+)
VGPIAVTGATGFVGRHVLAELDRVGADVVAVSRSARGATDERRRAFVDIDHPPTNLFDALHRPRTVIHLAWGGLPNYQSLHHLEEQLPRHYRFLKVLVQSGVENVLVAGTCLEYGLQSGCLSEEMPAEPTTPYAVAKDTLRRSLQCLRKVHGFNLTWARLFYMFGPGQASTSLLEQLRSAVQRGDAIFKMSGGEQLRDYLPVQEVAKHLVALATGACGHDVVNVCSGRPVSVRRLVEGWIESNDWNIKPSFGHYPYPEYEALAFWGDCRKLAACTGTGASAVPAPR